MEINKSYTVQAFYSRFSKVQQFIKQNHIDALLFVQGEDGLSTNNYSIFWNWLFLGTTGAGVFNEIYLNSIFDSSIFLITKNGIKCFCQEQICSQFQKYLISIPIKQIIKFSENEQLNNDEFELKKIRCFFDFVKDSDSFGILLDDQNVQDIDNWILGQVYSLEGVGGTFFSRKNKVFNLSSKLNTLYEQIDEPYIKLLQNNFTLMKNNFNLFHNLFLRLEIQNRTNENIIQLFKSQIETHEIKKLQTTSYSSQEFPNISTAHFDDNSLIYLTIKDICILSGLQFERTFFLTPISMQQQKVVEIFNEEGFLIDYELQIKEDPKYSYEVFLSTIYLKMFQFYQKIIEKFNSQINVNFLKKIRSLFEQKLKQLKYEEIKLESKISIIFKDNKNNETDLDLIIEQQDFKMNEFLENQKFMIRIEVRLIKNNQQQLIPLCLEDTFLVINNRLFNLTNRIPYVQIYKTQKELCESIKNIKELKANNLLGNRIINENQEINFHIPLKEKLKIFGADLGCLPSFCTFFEKGIKICSQQIGNYIIIYENQKCSFLLDPQSFVLQIDMQQPIAFQKFASKSILFNFKKSDFENFQKLTKFYENNYKQNLILFAQKEQSYDLKTDVFEQYKQISDLIFLKEFYRNEKIKEDNFNLSKYEILLNQYQMKVDVGNENLIFLFSTGLYLNEITKNIQLKCIQNKIDINCVSLEYEQNEEKIYEEIDSNIKTNKLILIEVPFFINPVKVIKKYQTRIRNSILITIQEALELGSSRQNYYIYKGLFTSVFIKCYKTVDYQLLNSYERYYSDIEFHDFQKEYQIGQYVSDLIQDTKFVNRKNQLWRNQIDENEIQENWEKILISYPLIKEKFIENLSILQKNRGYICKEEFVQEIPKNKLEEQIFNVRECVYAIKQQIQQNCIRVIQITGIVQLEEQYYYVFSNKQNTIVNITTPQNAQIFILKEKSHCIDMEFWFRKSLNISLIKNLNHLSEEQINEILLDYSEQFLNQGDFFDGFLWRNFKGKPYSNHPSKIIRQK